ncbi:MAG: 16S rRNA (cytosine(1402)-N(4))-methyltransferase RsmH [Burkholderiaceae bacterium]
MDTYVAVADHIPVLLAEAVDGVFTRPDGLYVDCTFGRGGHTRALLERLDAHGRLFALDRDPDAVRAMSNLSDSRFLGRQAPFAELGDCLAAWGVTAVDGVLMDLGVSSAQIDTAERGFSFRQDGPLDMRMDPASGESAADFLASASVRTIAEVIRNYGEERYAVQIATAIAARREERPLGRTSELAALVAGVVRSHEPGQNPATRTFQALRIHVNQELAQLEQGLIQAAVALKPGGRLAAISFHSLEDRIVKQFIDKLAHPERLLDPRLRRLPVPLPVATFKKVARVKCSAAEAQRNPRARSAMLRVAEKIGAAD